MKKALLVLSIMMIAGQMSAKNDRVIDQINRIDNMTFSTKYKVDSLYQEQQEKAEKEHQDQERKAKRNDRILHVLLGIEIAALAAMLGSIASDIVVSLKGKLVNAFRNTVNTAVAQAVKNQ